MFFKKLNNKIDSLSEKFSINLKVLLFTLILTIVPIHFFIYAFSTVYFIYILPEFFIDIDTLFAYKLIVILAQFLFIFLYLKSKHNRLVIFYNIVIYIHLYNTLYFLEFKPITIMGIDSIVDSLDIYEIPFLIFALLIYILNKTKIYLKDKPIFN